MPRMIDWWMLANLVTLHAVTITATLTWQWHEANRRAARTEHGPSLGVLRINILLCRLWLALNAAVFALGAWLVLVAHGIDVRASAAHPARVAGFVVSGTIAFTLIWCFACRGVWALKGRLDRLAVAEDEARPLRVVEPRERKMGGD